MLRWAIFRSVRGDIELFSTTLRWVLVDIRIRLAAALVNLQRLQGTYRDFMMFRPVLAVIDREGPCYVFATTAHCASGTEIFVAIALAPTLCSSFAHICVATDRFFATATDANFDKCCGMWHCTWLLVILGGFHGSWSAVRASEKASNILIRSFQQSTSSKRLLAANSLGFCLRFSTFLRSSLLRLFALLLFLQLSCSLSHARVTPPRIGPSKSRIASFMEGDFWPKWLARDCKVTVRWQYHFVACDPWIRVEVPCQ